MGVHSLILVSLGTCRSPFLGTHAPPLFLLSFSLYIDNLWPDFAGATGYDYPSEAYHVDHAGEDYDE